MLDARALKLFLSCLLVSAFCTLPAFSANEQTFRVPDLPLGDQSDFSRFGADVDIDGGRMVVGAPALEAIYIYEYRGDEWEYVEKLLVPPGLERAGFGAEVSLDGDWLAVALSDASVEQVVQAGMVLVYRYDEPSSQWVEQARVVSPSPVTSGRFGMPLVIDGTRLAVMAPGENASVHLFERDPDGSWRAVLHSPGAGPESGGGFSSTVALSGNRLAHLQWPRGIVLVYEHMGSGWQLVQELRSQTEGSDPSDVALEGDLLAISDPFGHATSLQRREGIVQIYVREPYGWRLDGIVHAEFPTFTYMFGYKVAIGDGVILAGQRPENGQAEAFARNENGQWQRVTTISAYSSRDGSYKFALDNGFIIVGKPLWAQVSVTDIRDLLPANEGAEDDQGPGDDQGGEEGEAGNSGGDDGQDDAEDETPPDDPDGTSGGDEPEDDEGDLPVGGSETGGAATNQDSGGSSGGGSGFPTFLMLLLPLIGRSRRRAA